MAFNKQGQGGVPQQSTSSRTFTSGGGDGTYAAAAGAGQATNPQPQQHPRWSAAAAARASVMHQGQQQAAGRIGDGYAGQQHQQQPPERRRQMGDGGGSALMQGWCGFGSDLNLPTSTSTRGQPLSQWFNFGHRFRGGFRNDDCKLFHFFIFVNFRNIKTIALGRLQKKILKDYQKYY